MCNIKAKYEGIVRNYNNLFASKDWLQERNKLLEERVEELEVVAQEYWWSHSVLGLDKIDNLLKDVNEKEWRKLQRRNKRDAR